MYFFHFNSYFNEVLSVIANLPLGSEHNGKKVNIYCCADYIALRTPTEIALQYMLDMLAPKLEKRCPKINILKTCNIAHNHKIKRFSTALTSLNGHP